MKRYYLKIRIGLITFALGLATVGFINNNKIVDTSTMIEVSTIVYTPPRFVKISDVSYSRRSISIYVSSDGQEVLSGNVDSFNKSGMKERIRRAKRIIEKENGRYILEFQTKKERHYEILQYVTDESYHFIRAETLELALEFEEIMTCKGDSYLETE